MYNVPPSTSETTVEWTILLVSGMCAPLPSHLRKWQFQAERSCRVGGAYCNSLEASDNEGRAQHVHGQHAPRHDLLPGGERGAVRALRRPVHGGRDAAEQCGDW